MNLPNKITIFRMCLIPIFLVFLYIPYTWGKPVALGIFVLASATDWIDGYIARKEKLVTDFGKFLDPLADKLLVSAALIVLVDFGYLPAWAVITIISREFIVTGMRLMAASSSIVIAASMWGKVKTTVQMSMIITLFVAMIFKWDVTWFPFQLLIYTATALTVVSGADYLIKHKQLFTDK